MKTLIWVYAEGYNFELGVPKGWELLTKVFFSSFQMVAATPINEFNNLQEFQRKYQESIKALDSEMDHLEVSFKFDRRKRIKFRE